MSTILPKISILTPTLNSGKDIESCILSVANQKYKSKEHLIIDGLSTDDTLDIVKKYSEKYPHIRWISGKDDGIYNAINKGIDMVSGEWIYCLGSDDVLMNNNVFENIFTQINIKDIDILYGNVKFKHSGIIYDGKFNFLKLTEKNICHQGIFFKRDVFQKLGKFETKYQGVADWVFNMQWFNESRFKKKYINEIIAIFNEDGYSFNNLDTAFAVDRELLIKTYFSKFDYFIYINKSNWLIDKIIKSSRIIK